MFARQNWYVAARSDEIDQKPLNRTVLDSVIAFFRSDDGSVSALDAMCPHRGGDLSRGRVVHNTLECPWHGWRYDATGLCVEIPSLGPCGKIPQMARVTSHPIVERQGLVYVWMDANAEPTWQPPDHPFLDAKHHVRVKPRLQGGSFINTVEAACDDSHVFIAHRNTIGRGAPKRLAPITNVCETQNGRCVEGDMIWPADLKRKQSWLTAWTMKHMLGLGEDSGTHDRHYSIEINGFVTHTYRKADGYDFVVYAATTPASDQSNWFFAGLVDTNPDRSLLGNALYLANKKQSLEVFEEDEHMLTSTLTGEYPGGHPRPVSVNADSMGMAFRRIYARQVQAEGGEPMWPASKPLGSRLSESERLQTVELLGD